MGTIVTEIDCEHILKSLPAVTWVYSTAEQNFVYISDGVEEMFGYPVDRWLDGPDFAIGFVHPEDKERVLNVSREALKSLKPAGFPWRAKCADGNYRWVESRFNVVEADDGLQLFGYFIEVHGSPETHVDFFELVNQSSDAMLLLSSTGVIEAVNKALTDVIGVDQQELVGHRYFEVTLFRSEEIEALEAELSRALDGRDVDPLEVSLTSKSEEILVFEAIPSLVRSRQGAPRLLLSLRDITERKKSEEFERQLEARVARSQRLESIGRLAGGIAHDFNNLLTVMMSNIDLLLERDDLSQPARQDVESIGDAARRSAELTGQLLAFGRKQMLSPRTIDTNMAVMKTARIVSRLFDENTEIEFDLDDAAWPMHVDPTKFEQVLVNLLVNSKDAMPAGGKVTISTENVRKVATEEGEWVCIRVIDNGTGIAPEHVEQIFEPFFTTKPPGLGTGLGLATVHGVVKQSGGRLEVDTAINRGTKISVCFPRSLERPEMEEVDGVKHRQGRPCQVLIVEDQPLVRRAASRILAADGYEVHQAENVTEAWEVIGREEIGAVVCDLNLGFESGWDLKRKMDEENLQIPVVFMSGDPASMREDLEGESFVQKPFSRETIVDAVNEAVENGAISKVVSKSDR